MSIIGRRLPIRKPKVWILALCLPLVGTAALLWLSTLGETRQNAEVSVSLALPPRPLDASERVGAIFAPDPDASSVAGAPANPAFTEPGLDPLKPREPDLDLVDASPFGPLPRIATDGRRPAQIYARPHDRNDDRPKVAIMVTGLGPQVDATNATFHLPGAISLMFSPYTEDLPALFERARLAGHEVLIELPMEPADYPASDPGPHTLRASGTVDANIERLHWILSRAPGYFAVAGRGGTFASSPEATPVIKALASMGIGMIEIDSDGLATAGSQAGLPYLSASNWIDVTPSAIAIDQALAELETKAQQEGSALGVTEAYPVTLQRLVDWSASLEERGIALVPVSAILLDETTSPPDDNQASSVAQSRN